MKHLWIALMGWLVLAALVPTHAAKTNVVVTAHVSKPGLDLYVYRRSYTPQEKVSVRLSSYNLKTVNFSIYALDLPKLMPTSKPMEEFGKPLKTLDLTHQKPIKTWAYSVGKIYPDNWSEREVKTPLLTPGVYVIAVRANGLEKRTWLAVTNIALLVKGSRQETLVYAAQAESGQPVSQLLLTLTDAQGNITHGVTDALGVARVPRHGANGGTLWIYGKLGAQPAFALSGMPTASDPYTVYTVTDRPIYRPGQTVQIKGTVRQRLEKNVPGGFAYQTFGHKSVTLEIRDATDALVSQHVLTTNEAGSFDATFALGSETSLGHWQLVTVIGNFRSYAAFDVQSYRKPEYTVDVHFDTNHILGGNPVPVTIDAQYFFGQPVANAAVTYQITFSSISGNDAEPNYNGQGVTDAQGKLHLIIPTQRLGNNRSLSVSATVTDLSRRSQSGDSSTLVTAGLFTLFLETDKQVYHAGEQAIVTVHAQDYDLQPVKTSVKVNLVETLEDQKHRPVKKITTYRVMTNAAGVGTAKFALPRPGYLDLQAKAFDTADNKIETADSLWVAGDGANYDYPTLDLVPDKPTYQPGQSARVLLNTNLVGPKSKTVWALVTLEGERLYRHEVVALTSKSTILHLPLQAEQFPSVQLNVAIVQGRHVMEGNTRLTVVRDEQKLHVTVTPNADKLSPGQSVTYTITTKDFRGKPVGAEVALGVVDASIYAIQADNTAPIEAAFYSGQDVRVQTDFSFAAQYSGGAYQTVPSPAPGQPGIRLRRQFADTAYWNPFVVTDASGVGQATFTVPDNLTTWRATVRGITQSTSVGAATQDTVSTMPLLVRLELPRFFVQGDQATVSALVHNYTDTERTVVTEMTVTGATLNTDTKRSIVLPPGGQQRLDWHASLSQTTSARFLVTADGGVGARDATELVIPVAPAGLKVVEAHADTLTDTSNHTEQDLTALASNASVTVTLSPSVASAMFDALDFLTSYPYGCAEQTTSATIPNVIVDQAFRRLGVPRKADAHLGEWVNLAIQKLYHYQHSDGGWNWWENDDTDGDMTAYILSGLLTAKHAGYLVDDQRILRGTEALLRLLNNEHEPSKRADWLMTLASVCPKDVTKPLEELYEKRAELDAYGQASLCLALMPLGGASRDHAITLAHELEAKAHTTGRLTNWPAEVNGYAWRDDDTTVTAHVLRALLAAIPDSPQIVPAVTWLMANRDGTAWGSTKSSAEAVTALTQYLEQTHELQPNYHAQVLLDGKSVGELTATPKTVFDAPVSITLTSDQLRGHKQLTVTKDGQGTLYVGTVIASLLPPEQAKPQTHGIHVTRTFQVTASDPSQAGTIASSSEITVRTEIISDADCRYAMLEDPIPAGCEVVGDDESSATRREVRDNRVVFFFDHLPKGSVAFVYRLRAETPGQYRILPGIASLAYFPEVRGNSGLVTVNISEGQ